jgi:predicted DNA-binding ribbon-helix-helix protein
LARVAAGDFGFLTLILNKTQNHGTMLRESQVCSKEDAMKSPITKRSVVIGGHKTSISLEDAFWTGLKEIAQAQGASVAQTVTGIDTTRQQEICRRRSACLYSPIFAIRK